MPKYLSTNQLRFTDGTSRLKTTLMKGMKKLRNKKKKKASTKKSNKSYQTDLIWVNLNTNKTYLWMMIEILYKKHWKSY